MNVPTQVSPGIPQWRILFQECLSEGSDNPGEPVSLLVLHSRSNRQSKVHSMKTCKQKVAHADTVTVALLYSSCKVHSMKTCKQKVAHADSYNSSPSVLIAKPVKFAYWFVNLNSWPIPSVGI